MRCIKIGSECELGSVLETDADQGEWRHDFSLIMLWNRKYMSEILRYYSALLN